MAVLSGCTVAPPTGSTSPAALPTAPVSPSDPSSPSDPPSSPARSATASATPSASPSRPAATRPRDKRTAAQRSRAFVVDGIPVVSKKHPIDARYRRSSVTSPYGLTRETQRGLARMISAARAKGVRILVHSGYRGYAQQAQILASKIREYGSESLARRYNAAPGRSEHQTGLAVDLWDGATWGLGVRNTKTGKWLWANAWRYGFILRYPSGKEKITGYAFEPWHYRYIGARAKDFGANSNRTLEEYLRLA